MSKACPLFLEAQIRQFVAVAGSALFFCSESSQTTVIAHLQLLKFNALSLAVLKAKDLPPLPNDSRDKTTLGGMNAEGEQGERTRTSEARTIQAGIRAEQKEDPDVSGYLRDLRKTSRQDTAWN